jgi:CRISPR-associated protein Cas2
VILTVTRRFSGNEKNPVAGVLVMMVLVTYDVNTETAEARARLRRVAKVCENAGQRVQNSVFECLIDPAQWTALRERLIKIIDEEKDSLRFYFLGRNWKRRVEHIGAKEAYDPEGPLIV